MTQFLKTVVKFWALTLPRKPRESRDCSEIDNPAILSVVRLQGCDPLEASTGLQKRLDSKQSRTIMAAFYKLVPRNDARQFFESC